MKPMPVSIGILDITESLCDVLIILLRETQGSIAILENTCLAEKFRLLIS